MKLKYLVVKEEVKNQRVSVEHISTNLMVANPLTNGLPPRTFNEHVERMDVTRNPCWHYDWVYVLNVLAL